MLQPERTPDGKNIRYTQTAPSGAIRLTDPQQEKNLRQTVIELAYAMQTIPALWPNHAPGQALDQAVLAWSVLRTFSSEHQANA